MTGIGGDQPRQSDDEVAAHMAPDGPVQAACDFLEALLFGEPDRAWSLATRELRESAEEVSPLWAWDNIGLNRETYEASRWGFASRPRPLGLDRELVILVEGPPGEIIDRLSWRPGVHFVMERHRGAWLVASLRDPRESP